MQALGSFNTAAATCQAGGATNLRTGLPEVVNVVNKYKYAVYDAVIKSDKIINSS